MTQAQNLANLSQDYGVIPMSCRNYIVDPCFEYQDAQYPSPQNISGTSNLHSVTAMYWSSAGTGGAATINQYTPAPGVVGSTPGGSDAEFGLVSWAQTTAHSGTLAAYTAAYIKQNIESVKSLAGRSSTFSLMLVNTGSTAFTIQNIFQRQNFGTGGSPSAAVTIDKTVNWVIPAGGWKRYSVRLDWPSVNGKTLGTNGNDYAQIGLWLPPGVTFSFYTTQWQLEQSNPLSSSDINGAGGEPTAFEYRGRQAELARVDRQYEVVVCNDNNYVPSGTGCNRQYAYRQQKRSSPAISTSTLSLGGCTFNSVTYNPNGAALSVVATATGQIFMGGTMISDARL